ncbi:MAG TPA: hypothetical protein VFN13_10720 [Rudaea sp.]|nr:hypothetical protein [Rudaea sp.]
MKALCKTFVLLLASIVLASCGGGGGGNNSAFGGAPVLSVTITPASSTISTNSFTTLIVTVKNPDGTPAQDGAGVNATLSPATIGTLSGAAGSSGTTATNVLSGGTASFTFNSSNQAGTAHIIASVTIVTTGSVTGTVTYTGSTNVTVNAGNTQDARLQLSATSTTLPLNPYNSSAYPFPGNYIGSPFISEVTITWRHTNGQLVSGTTPVNVSINPVTVAGFSTLDDPTTKWDGLQKNPPTAEGNEFLTILGSGPVNVTGGNGTVFVHSFDTPGTTTLSVTAVDPDNGQTISSQLTFTVAGSAASNLPSSISATPDGGVYVSGSGGPQSTQIRAVVTNGNGVGVADPGGFDNVQFEIVGPAGNDARLTGIDASGHTVTGGKIATVTHNGIAGVTFQAGTQQGPVQVKATADRGDNNVDNQIQDAVSATATVVVSDGKLDSITINSPDTDSVNATGVSANATEDPPGSGNYQLTISATGVDRQGNAVLPGTQIAFGAIDSPQLPVAGSSPQAWFQISGTRGDPQEGGNLFTATDGHFVSSSGSSAGPGDTLLVIGKQSQGAPAGNDDLESAAKITRINTATSLNVATPFNLNDRSGVSVDNHDVLPYIIGRAEFTSIGSPGYTDSTSANPLTGTATTTLNYSASQIGKAVAIWAQGTGTDVNTSPGRTDLITDVRTIVLPGSAVGAILTASPDPILGNTQQAETVCYYDGNNRPIPNYAISFAFTFNGVGAGSADGVSNSGKFKHLTGSDGCVTVNVITASVPPTGATTPPFVTFSVGPINSSGTSGGSPVTVDVPIVVNAAQLQVSCPAGTDDATGTVTNYSVTLRLLDGTGNGIAGESITGQCVSADGSVNITQQPGVTDAAGSTTAIISTPKPPTSSGTCTFQSSTFSNLVATVNIGGSGSSSCSGGFSPQPH